MTRLSINNRSLFRQTATALALLLLLSLLPSCAAKHMPDWSKVQALSPGVITRVQLDKNEAPSGGRKIKGFFSSATDTSITLLFADGRTRTIEKRTVRTVRVRRPFKERYTGFVIGAAVAVGTGILYGGPGDYSLSAKFLIPIFITVPATVAGFFMAEKEREKILTLGPLEVLFTSPSKIREAAPQATGDSGPQDKKTTSDGR